MASIHEIRRTSGPRNKVVWRDPRTHRQETQTFRSREMAWNKKITVEADIIRGQRVSRTQQRQSFETLAEFWYRNHVHRHLTQKVAQWYRYKLDRQLLPFWAKIQVGNIDADTVSQWAEWCEKEGWSPWTILEAFTAFSAALG